MSGTVMWLQDTIKKYAAERKVLIAENDRLKTELAYALYYMNRGKTEKRKAWNLNNQKKVRARHPLKYHCHSITSGAINRGKLLKQSCEICDSSSRVEAHHESYYEPLNVKWLCMKHHRELHKKIRSEGI